MKIAITGGAGFVGSHLAKAYLDAGHDVLVIDSLVNGSRQGIDSRARFYHLDIRDTKLQTILQLERPDVVSHQAAQRAPSFPGESSLSDADVHVRGLLNVLESCVGASVRKLIFASGGPTLYTPIPYSKYEQETLPIVREDAPLCPQLPADITKVAGEWYVRYYTQQYGLEHTILRYAHIYGEKQSELAQHPAAYFISMLSQRQRPIIRGSAHDVCDHIFIDDVAQANLRTLERGRNCTMHISSGKGYTLNQFFCAITQHLSCELLPLHISGSLGEPTAIVLDNTLARQQLGWQPEISFSEGVKRTVGFLCGNRVNQPQVQAHAHQRVAEAVLV